MSVKKGTVLGEATVYQAGAVVATADLVAKDDVEQPTPEQLADFYWMQLLNSTSNNNKLLYLHLMDPFPLMLSGNNYRV